MMALRSLCAVTPCFAKSVITVSARSVTTSASMKEFRRSTIASNRLQREARYKEELDIQANSDSSKKKLIPTTKARKTLDKIYNATVQERPQLIAQFLKEESWKKDESWFYRDWSHLLRVTRDGGDWKSALNIFQTMRDNAIYTEKSAFVSLIKVLEKSNQYYIACQILEKLRRYYPITTLDYLGNKIAPELPPFELPNLSTYYTNQHEESINDVVRFISLCRSYNMSFVESTWNAYLHHLSKTNQFELLVTEVYEYLSLMKLCDKKVPEPFAPYRINFDTDLKPKTTLPRKFFLRAINAAEYIGNYSAALDMCLMYRYIFRNSNLYLSREYTDYKVRRDYLDATYLTPNIVVGSLIINFVELRIRRAMEKAMRKLPERPVTHNLPENLNYDAPALSAECADILLLTDRTLDGSPVKYPGSNTHHIVNNMKQGFYIPIDFVIASRSTLSEVHTFVDSIQSTEVKTATDGPELTIIIPRENIIKWCETYSKKIAQKKF